MPKAGGPQRFLFLKSEIVSATIRPCVQLAWQASPRLFVLSAAMTALTGIMPLAAIFVNAELVGLLAGSIASTQPAEAVLPAVGKLLAWLALSIVVATLVNKCAAIVRRLHQRRVGDHVQARVMQVAAQEPLREFENAEFQNELQQASSEARHRPSAIVYQLMECVSALATMLATGAVLASWNLWLLPCALVCPCLSVWLSRHVSAEALALKKRATEAERRASYLGMVLTSDIAAKEVRLLDLQPLFLRQLKSIWAALFAEELEFGKRRLLSYDSVGALLGLDRIALLGYAVREVVARRIDLGAFTLYAQSLQSFQSHAKTLGATVAQLHEHHLFLAALLRLLERPGAPRLPQTGHAALGAAPTIEFRRVWFRYAADQPFVLQDVSFEIPFGQVVALVGANGSGKSTLIKLLTGLYEPTEGAIFIGGRDIAEMKCDELRKQLAVVLQDYYIFHLSVHDNVAVGCPGGDAEARAVARAAERTGLDRVAAELPAGFATILGRHFTKGQDLSGGQRQLVAATRAVIRQARILILDEPTSALDAHHEQRFFRSFLREPRTERQTTLLITHRLSSVRHADRILVLSAGRMIEDGTHEALISAGAAYARLYQAQLALFEKEELGAAKPVSRPCAA